MTNVVLPSGEANFFDVRQSHSALNGSGINASFPNPVSGHDVYNTYGENTDLIVTDQSGILSYNGPSGQFSNAEQSLISGILSFSAFNPYVHYIPQSTPNNVNKTTAVTIQYVSDSVVSPVFNPYPL